MQKDAKQNSQMDKSPFCEDLSLQIPCELVTRVRQYAQANKTDLTNVVIEALDAFLRGNNT
jgi:hypothetical protein